MRDQAVLTIRDWVESLETKGRNAFALTELSELFPSFSGSATRSALSRLRRKGIILSIHKGYYLIISPQYRSKGILPPSSFMDGFMKDLKRPYYLALLSAAAYHGAAHQQPQEFFVVTTFPVLRPTTKRGLKINYLSKRKLCDKLIETRNTESGYLKISNAILTATDLIQYEKRVGGMNRVATVLSELTEAIAPEAFSSYLIDNTPVTSLQRFGFLLEKVLGRQSLADSLYSTLRIHHKKLFRIPLSPTSKRTGSDTDDRWKVIINISISVET